MASAALTTVHSVSMDLLLCICYLMLLLYVSLLCLSLFCNLVLSVLSSFAIFLLKNREMVTLLCVGAVVLVCCVSSATVLWVDL